MADFSEKIYQVVRSIPRGKVATYGQVASAANNPLAFRAVGNALHQNPYPDVPCHRVVNSRGGLATNFGKGGWREQKRLLLAEKIVFKSGKIVDLKASRAILN